MKRTRLLIGGFAAVGLVVAGCGSPAPAPAEKPAPAADAPHEHKAGAHGGTVVPLGRESYHAEPVFEADGRVRLYVLGRDESRVQEAEAQELAAFVTPEGGTEATRMTLKPEPQPGDAPGKTSRFLGELPKALAGRAVRVTIPNLSVNGERFRLAFANAPAEGHAGMPAKKPADEERAVFLTPGGLYTSADIAANGKTTPAAKYRGIPSKHDENPKPGDKVCPVSRTKANPRFAWQVGGKTYEFCCVPCVEEFVGTAKENPGAIRDPKDYVKQ